MTRKNKRMLSKTLALFLAMLLSVGNLSVTAFAAETDEAAGGSGDMAVTEIADITDAVFGEGEGADDSADDFAGTEADTGIDADAPAENPAGDDAEAEPDLSPDGLTTETQTETDTWDDGETAGSETTTTETTKDPDGNIVDETVKTEGSESTNGGSSSSTGTETVLPDGLGDVATKPGESGSVSGTIGDSLRPDTSGDEWTENDDGSFVKTENVDGTETVTTVTENTDEDGKTVYTTETVSTTVKTTETYVSDAPEAGETENADGSKTIVTVEKDEAGNVTSWTEVVETRDENGVLVSSVTKTVTASGTMTETSWTKTVSTVAVDKNASGSVNVEMGEVVAGGNHGNLNTHGPDVETGEIPDCIEFDDLDGDTLVFVAGIGVQSVHYIRGLYGNNVNSINTGCKFQPSQYVVVDKNGNKHVVYCADLSVSIDAAVEYYLTNVEDADYYTNSENHGAGKNDLLDPDGGDHLKEIATNGYWGTAEGTGSLEKMIQDLLDAKASGNEALKNVTEDEIKSLTGDLALAATQAAIWRYGNAMGAADRFHRNLSTMIPDDVNLSYDPSTHTFTNVTETVDPETGETVIKTDTWTIKVPAGINLEDLIKVQTDDNGRITVVTCPQFVKSYVKLIPDKWLHNDNANHALLGDPDKNSEDNRMALAIYDWLCGLESDEDTTTDLIQPSDIVEAVTNVKNEVVDQDTGESRYEADVSFVLTVQPDRLNGDLLVHVYDAETGEILATRRVAGEGDEAMAGVQQTDKGTVYTVDGLVLANGQTVRLSLVGSQAVEKGAYLITAKNGHGESQTFIGMEEGTRDVDLSFTLKLDVQGAVIETTESVESGSDKTWSSEQETVYNYYELELPEEPPVEPPVDPEEPPVEPPVDPEEPPVQPDPEEPEIPDPDVPLAPEPEIPQDPPVDPQEPEEEIPDPEVPLAPEPEIPQDPPVDPQEPEEEIPDPEVPLSDIPQTGDESCMAVYITMMVLSMAGMAVLAFSSKSRKDRI